MFFGFLWCRFPCFSNISADHKKFVYFQYFNCLSVCVCECECECKCVCVCGHVYVVYEDTNLYNDMGIT